MADIPGSEWRKIRDMKSTVLDRVCKNILDQLAAESRTDEGSQHHHDQYLKISRLLRDNDDLIAQGFDNLKRSNAYLLLAAWIRQQWLTSAEFERFSKETRDKILLIADLDHYTPPGS